MKPQFRVQIVEDDLADQVEDGSMQQRAYIRKTGIEAVGDVPWGTHLCQFYQTKQDLFDLIVPYIAAGLEGNELCMWIAAPPLSVEEAQAALRAALPDFERYRKRGSIKILPHTAWYLQDGKFDRERVLAGWLAQHDAALARGYTGLRAVGDVSWVSKPMWPAFAMYEATVDELIDQYRMLALCIYALDQCGAAEVIEVAHRHQFALIRRDGRWIALENPERKHMEEVRRLATIVENSGDAIYSTTLDGVIATWNAGAERTYGYSAQEVAGRHVSILAPTERANECRDVLQWIMHGKRTEYFETVRIRKDGVPIHMHMTVSPVADQAGNVVGAAAIARDISERKGMEEALRASEGRLREQAAQLAEADRRKNEFLAVLGHELRNPLVPIYSTLQLFKLRPIQCDPRLAQGLEIMDRQVEQIRRLVDDLLDVSRIAQGRIVLHTEPVDLAKIIARAVDATRLLIKLRRHKLKVSLPPEPIKLEADPVRLAQVIGNLLDNAAKYTQEGGRIELTIHCEGDEAVICVRDTGMGIPPEILPHMFELFSQAEHSLEYARGGLGIGLNLVRNLVQLHGGSVQAESAGPGKGSTFTVRLPLAQRGATCSESGTVVQAAPAPRRILVVEDNPDVAKSFAMLLDTLGHEVQIAPDGASVLEAVPRLRPDIVFVDIGLPDMDGYEVARRLRAAHGRALHLVALSGYGQEEVRHCAREAGFDQHLTKPVDLEALERLLASAGPDLNESSIL